MSAQLALLNAYSKWHRLAVAEGQAIQMRNWSLLLECQQAIKTIQPFITRLSREVRDEWKQSGADSIDMEKNVRDAIIDLIELGKRNKMLLQAAREVARMKCEQLEQAGHNLKRLQLSYLSARPASWTSFS